MGRVAWTVCVRGPCSDCREDSLRLLCEQLVELSGAERHPSAPETVSLPFLTSLSPWIGCKLGQRPGGGAGAAEALASRGCFPKGCALLSPGCTLWTRHTDTHVFSLLSRSQARWELQHQGPPEGTPLASRSRVKAQPPLSV